MRVLAVATDAAALPGVSEEAAAIVNELDGARLLQGEEATARGIIDMIARFGPFDVLWILGHGGREGVMGARGTLIAAYDLAAFALAARAEVIVLNTCGSRHLVEEIQLRAPVAVIATEAEEITDPAAWQFGRLLAMEMGRAVTIREAVERAAPGGGRHRYYEYRGSPSMDRSNRQQQPAAAPRGTDEKIDLIFQHLLPNPLTGEPGALGALNQISASLAKVMEGQEIGQANHDRNSQRITALATLSWINLAITAGLTITSIILVVRVFG